MSAVALGLLSLSAPAQQPEEPAAENEQPPAEEIDLRALSYALGYDLGRTLSAYTVGPFELDIEEITAGLSASVKEWEPAYSEEMMERTVQQWVTKQQALQQEQRRQTLENEGVKNLEEARQVARRNRQNRKIKETESGLQYQALKKGKGPRPQRNDWVKVHYVGTVPDGQVFDSSRQREEPIVFRLDQVIQGWTEGVQLMRRNALFRFHIPPHLAYGSEGVSDPAGLIGPNKLLVFEVELLDFSASQESLED